MFYTDKNIINNSSLACFLLIYFIEQYEELSVDNRKAELMKLLLVLPFAWHEVSRNAIKTRKLSTPFSTILMDTPLIKANIKQRITDYSGATTQGLNMAVSSGLLIRSENNPEISFETNFSKWPPNVKNSLPDDMTKTINRLANWFHYMDTASIYRLLLGKTS
ncbi:three component ABC system middle component [Buttiauxella noackiae]|uniref:three component ABC system middle component n=1 Tax=Buttiauxella noackiae TaxID=82992 RepID=UPI000556362E|nr:three component ABC system middle component [Buttiauxella noackiae]